MWKSLNSIDAFVVKFITSHEKNPTQSYSILETFLVWKDNHQLIREFIDIYNNL